VIFNFLNNINEFLKKETKVNDLRSALRYHGQQNTYYIEKIYANSLTDSSEILVFLIVLLKNGCWVFSVALKNIDQKVAFSIVDFEIGSFSLLEFLKKETKVNDLRSALRYHGQQNTYYIENIYANSDLDSVFTKTLEILRLEVFLSYHFFSLL
jgi:hypothetical protein